VQPLNTARPGASSTLVNHPKHRGRGLVREAITMRLRRCVMRCSVDMSQRALCESRLEVGFVHDEGRGAGRELHCDGTRGAFTPEMPRIPPPTSRCEQPAHEWTASAAV
jgi:hypothetical protein